MKGHGRARTGQVWRCGAWRGAARQGMARRSHLLQGSNPGVGLDEEAGHGGARTGRAGHGMVRTGAARLGKGSTTYSGGQTPEWDWMEGSGSVRRGSDRWGKSRPGRERSGLVGKGMARRGTRSTTYSRGQTLGWDWMEGHGVESSGLVRRGMGKEGPVGARHGEERRGGAREWTRPRCQSLDGIG